MSWLYIIIAGIFEVVWVVTLKYCKFKIDIFFFITSITMILSTILLGLAVKHIPTGVAYAAWSGIGVIGVFLYNIFILKEPISLINIIFVTMIMVGVIGLKLADR